MKKNIILHNNYKQRMIDIYRVNRSELEELTIDDIAEINHLVYGYLIMLLIQYNFEV